MQLDVVIVNYFGLRALACGFERIHAELLTLGPCYVLVDNSPGDGVREFLEGVVGNLKTISNRTNVGFAAAVNQAVAASEGDLILLLNPDVSGLSGDLERICLRFTSEADLCAVGVRLVNEDGTTQASCRRRGGILDYISESVGLSARLPRWRRLRRFRMLDWDYSEPRYVESLSGAFLILRREAFLSVGPFDERFFVYGEETDWLLRASERGWRTLFDPSVSVTHRQSSGTELRADEVSLLLMESRLKFVRKHLGVAREMLLRGILVAYDGLRLLKAYLTGRGQLAEELRSRIEMYVTGRGSRA